MFSEEPSSFFHTKVSATQKGATLCKAGISTSLKSLRGRCKTRFAPYDMNGAKSATTTVTLPDGQKKIFKTSNQMHSEMLAIQWMLNNEHWTVYLGSVIWAHDHSEVSLSEFKTTQPHCGFCTLFLLAAGLPVGTPTYGNYQLASRLAYQLPYELETSPHFIAKVLDKGCYCGFPALKRLLNAFMQCPADQWLLSIHGLAYVDDHTYVALNTKLLVVDWDTLVEMYKREVIYLAWKVIYEQIMLTNKEGSK
jgi:hypothetical protein